MYLSQIEFIENKGQWNNEVKFMSLAGSGAFYLQQNGFTVAQHNPDDIENIKERMHRAMLRATLLIQAAGIKIHSHAYTVSFLMRKTRRSFLISLYHLLIIILSEMIKVNGHPIAGFSRELPIKMFTRV